MPHTPSFVAGDTGSKLVVPCFDKSTGDAILSADIDHAHLRFWYDQETVTTQRDMIFQSSSNLVLEYLFLGTELRANKGRLNCEVTLYDVDDKFVTQLDPLKYGVREKRT